MREELDEMFAINRLGLPKELRRCLNSTNVIDSPHSCVRQRTQRVTHWQGGQMALRWPAGGMAEAQKSFRKIMGHHQLWILKASLNEAIAEEAIIRKTG